MYTYAGANKNQNIIFVKRGRIVIIIKHADGRLWTPGT